MAASQFLLVDGTPVADYGTQIGSGQRIVRFGQRDEEDICVVLQPTSSYQFLSHRPEKRPRSRQQQADTEPGHFAQASESASATQAEANEQAAHQALVFGTPCQFSYHRFCFYLRAVELHVRETCWITNLLEVLEDPEHIGRVL